jgi:glycosyltransferase involved in cell wall biosynthesis
MTPGLVITCFNRPQYLSKCLESLAAADLSALHCIVIVNDASTDAETLRLFREFYIDGVPIIKMTNERNLKVYGSLKRGWDKCVEQGCDVLMNLDSDAIVKADFVERLTDAVLNNQVHVVTGFNSRNKKKDGTDRHPVVSVHDGYLMKQSVGGINFAFTGIVYKLLVSPVLERCIDNPVNWDHHVCIDAMKADRPIICLTPSCVQHIGFDSSMGHNEPPDVACDFYNLALPDVTLVGVDCADVNRLIRSADACTKDIKFAGVKLFSSVPTKHESVLKCGNIKSKEQYSQFIVRDLYPHIETSHALIIQHDGHVVNYKAWNDEWLQYDYIGATWWYKDGMNVGNGGFSLRSRKLMEMLATDPEIKIIHPEDHAIGRVYRPYLESKGIKFAPDEVANRFSIEAHNSPKPANRYSGQFGFHGYNVDFTGTGYAPANKQGGKR